MRPHINIGTIGHVDHGKTTLTTAICATMEIRPDPIIVEAMPRRRSPMAAAWALPIMCRIMSMNLPGWSARNPSQQERNDPRREKTSADMERMEAAQRKRERKAARK